MQTQKGSITGVVIAIIVILIIVGFVALKKKSEKALNPDKASQTTAGVTQFPTGGPTSGDTAPTGATASATTGGATATKTTTNTSVDGDLQAVDTNMSGLSKDSASIDKGINDQPIAQPQ